MKTPEGKLKDQVKAFLRERGAYYHMPVQMGYGTPSLDFIGCHRGKFFAIETKAVGKRPTARQNLTMRDMQVAQANVVWINTIEELQSVWEKVWRW